MDLRRGRPAYRLSGHYGRVVDVAVSPQGQFVGPRAQTARRASGTSPPDEARSPRSPRATRISCTASRSAPAASSSSRRAATARRASGRPIEEPRSPSLAGHDGDVLGASFSRTGRRVLTYGEDGTARIWDSGDCGRAAACVARQQAAVHRSRRVRRRPAVRDDRRRRHRAHLAGRLSHPGHFRCAASATRASARTVASVATASADGTVRIWTCQRSAETRGSNATAGRRSCVQPGRSEPRRRPGPRSRPLACRGRQLESGMLARAVAPSICRSAPTATTW